MSVELPSHSARSDLATLTQARVMRGIADILASGGGDFTFRALAEASGVPERTIYRHYPTKDAVFAAFWTWINARLDMPPPPRSVDELIDQVPKLFAAFEAGEPVVRAMLHDPHGRAVRLANAAARRARISDALREPLTTLEPMEQKRLLATVQLLSSAASWESMKDQWGMTAGEAADAAQWAIGALIAQACLRPGRKQGSIQAGRGGAVSTKRKKG